MSKIREHLKENEALKLAILFLDRENLNLKSQIIDMKVNAEINSIKYRLGLSSQDQVVLNQELTEVTYNREGGEECQNSDQ